MRFFIAVSFFAIFMENFLGTNSKCFPVTTKAPKVSTEDIRAKLSPLKSLVGDWSTFGERQNDVVAIENIMVDAFMEWNVTFINADTMTVKDYVDKFVQQGAENAAELSLLAQGDPIDQSAVETRMGNLFGAMTDFALSFSAISNSSNSASPQENQPGVIMVTACSGFANNATGLDDYMKFDFTNQIFDTLETFIVFLVSVSA